MGSLVDPQVRASNDINVPSKLSHYLSGMGSDWSPTARSFLTRPPLADIFHPPYPPIASQSISRDVPWARARTFQPSSPLV